MWLNKIKKRKIQYLIIMLMLLIANAILVACISFAWETQHFVEDYYDVKKSPVYYSILSEDNGKEIIEQDATIMKMISKVVTGKAKIVYDDCLLDGKKLDNEEIIIYDVPNIDELGYKLEFAKGKENKSPKDNEIWICQIYAKAVGLKIGDEITFGKSKESYKISAIVNTPENNSNFMDQYPCYMNETTFNKVNGVEGYSVNLYAKDNNMKLKKLMENLPKEFTDKIIYVRERDSLKMCLSILGGIFGGVGIIAALLIFGVSIIVLRYLVRATLAKEYRMIGIYKALGRKSKEISNIYLTSYLVTGVVGILLGLSIAKPLAYYLANLVLGENKAFHLTSRTGIVMIIAVITMTLMLVFNIWIELRKVKNITPIKALAVGTMSSKEKLCKSIIPNAHSAFSLAINNCFKNRGMTILVIMILAVSFYVNLLCSSVGITLGNYSNDVHVWENLPLYDGYIRVNGDTDILDYLKGSPDLKDYVAMTLEPNCPELSFEGDTLTVNNANPMVYENFTEERYKEVPFTEGRICVNPHEVTCSEQFLDKANKSVGDYLKLKAGDKETNLLIVGSYSAMMKGGTSFYINDEDMEDLGLKTDLSTVLFFLKDGVTYKEFATDFEKHFPSANIGDHFSFAVQEGNTITDISNPICMVIFFAFLSFSLLNVINLLYTQTRENRKKYGILKSLGFTTRYIRKEVIFRTTIECVVAIIITLILHEFLSPIIFTLACGVRYICKPACATIAVCGGMYAIILAITILMILPIHKITPVELMEE